MTKSSDQPVTAGLLREILKEEREHTREIVRYEGARQLDEKLAAVNLRLDHMDTKLHRMDTRLERMDGKLDQIIETEDEDVRAVAGDVKKVDRHVMVLESERL